MINMNGRLYGVPSFVFPSFPRRDFSFSGVCSCVVKFAVFPFGNFIMAVNSVQIT